MKLARAIAVFVSFFAAGFAPAQDLGPQIRKLEDGIYVYVGKNFNSNCGIVFTREGVVLIDSGHNPTDSRAILEAVKKLTPLPVRFLIDTEPHPDHTTGHFVFSPPATIIAAEGAGASMRSREGGEPDRIHSRRPRRGEDDEEPQPGARRSRARDPRHGEDLRRQRKILRAAPRSRRQARKRRQVARPDQEGSAHARVRKLGRARALPDQRGGGLPRGERRLSACIERNVAGLRRKNNP